MAVRAAVYRPGAMDMAGLLPQPNCALCGRPVDPRGEFFRASGDFLPPGDPLRSCANAPLHWDCYAAWPERRRFARHFVDAWVRANRRNPFWWAVYRDERVYVSVNPEPPVEEASVRLYDVGSDVRVPLSRWTEWLADPSAVTPALQPIEQQALEAVLPTLRMRLPSDHAVVDAIDPDEKRPRAARGSEPTRSVR